MCRYASHGFIGHLRRVRSHGLGAAVGQGCGWAEYLKAQLRWVPTKRRRAVTVDTIQFMARADSALQRNGAEHGLFRCSIMSRISGGSGCGRKTARTTTIPWVEMV